MRGARVKALVRDWKRIMVAVKRIQATIDAKSTGRSVASPDAIGVVPRRLLKWRWRHRQVLPPSAREIEERRAYRARVAKAAARDLSIGRIKRGRSHVRGAIIYDPLSAKP